MELLEAVAHPIRIHALSVLSERAAGAKELAAELDSPVRHVKKHLEKLEELGLIAEVERGPSREKLYRTIKETWFDRESWRQLDPEDRPGVTGAIIELVGGDIATAMVAGTLDGEENHISRTPMLLDRQGYEELVALLGETLDRTLDLRRKASERLEGGETPIPTVVHLIQCDLPAADPQQPPPPPP